MAGLLARPTPRRGRHGEGASNAPHRDQRRADADDDDDVRREARMAAERRCENQRPPAYHLPPSQAMHHRDATRRGTSAEGTGNRAEDGFLARVPGRAAHPGASRRHRWSSSAHPRSSRARKTSCGRFINGRQSYNTGIWGWKTRCARDGDRTMPLGTRCELRAVLNWALTTG